MFEGQPFILVVGGANTGRSPLVTALVRRALPGVHVRSAGVVSHDGEPMPLEAVMTLEQLGVTLGPHAARPLDHAEVRQAELLLAVDRGIERVLQAQFPHHPRIAALSELARLPDVADPHRMPLGIWVASGRDLDTQVKAALGLIRECLPLAEPSIANAAQSIANDGRLGTAPPGLERSLPASAPTPDRAEALTRITRLVETAQLLPEIVDWGRLRAEVSERLRAIAATAAPGDLTPAAAAMIEGLLAQTTALPSAERLVLLLRLTAPLADPLDGIALARLGADVGYW